MLGQRERAVNEYSKAKQTNDDTGGAQETAERLPEKGLLRRRHLRRRPCHRHARQTRRRDSPARFRRKTRAEKARSATLELFLQRSRVTQI